MAVKILIKRKIPKNLDDPKFNKLIRQLRSLAIAHQGYISGETLKRVGRPQDYLVISTWQNMDAWKSWQTNRKRTEIQKKIDALLGVPTKYEAYEYL
ncbi:MAG: sugar biosynthesis protein [Syntrophales bacterium]|jgi:heme-degrading monooxygenase HmoA|nr:sugar biosynthesis protein [Syntrophales bacterium]